MHFRVSQLSLPPLPISASLRPGDQTPATPLVCSVWWCQDWKNTPQVPRDWACFWLGYETSTRCWLGWGGWSWGEPLCRVTQGYSPELWWGRTVNIPTPLSPSSVSSDLGCQSRYCLRGRIQAHTTATPSHVSTPTHPPGYADTRHTHQTRDGGSPQTVRRLCLLAGEAALVSKTHSRRESRFWDPTRDWFFSPFFSISKYQADFSLASLDRPYWLHYISSPKYFWPSYTDRSSEHEAPAGLGENNRKPGDPGFETCSSAPSQVAVTG